MSAQLALPANLERNPSIDHLILVCCHAIWLGGPSNGHNESEWYDNDDYLIRWIGSSSRCFQITDLEFIMDEKIDVDDLYSRINRPILMSNIKGLSSPSRKARLARFWNISLLVCVVCRSSQSLCLCSLGISSLPLGRKFSKLNQDYLYSGATKRERTPLTEGESYLVSLDDYPQIPKAA